MDDVISCFYCYRNKKNDFIYCNSCNLYYCKKKAIKLKYISDYLYFCSKPCYENWINKKKYL